MSHMLPAVASVWEEFPLVPVAEQMAAWQPVRVGTSSAADPGFADADPHGDWLSVLHEVSVLVDTCHISCAL